jgi:hypothetical protein
VKGRLGYSLAVNASDDFHSLAEARSWALHSEVARRLSSNPQIIERARKRVQEWLDDPVRHPYAKSWNELLCGAPTELALALMRKDDEMCTLRQASPFAGALDNHTRWQILKQSALRPRETS